MCARRGSLAKHGLGSCEPGGVYLCHISIIKNENTGVRVEGYARSLGGVSFLSFFRPTSCTFNHPLMTLYSACAAVVTDVCLTNYRNKMSNKGEILM